MICGGLVVVVLVVGLWLWWLWFAATQRLRANLLRRDMKLKL